MTMERPGIELGLMLAHTCNIACRHCGILSSPTNRNRMEPGMAERCIREAAALSGEISTIVFTGGEPFLFAEELERLLALCFDLGLSTRVVTNGFWAANPDRARGLLHRLRLAGLDTLNFSADKFHLEFLPPSTLRRAIALAQELGFPAIVNFVVSEPGDPVQQFCAMYGLPADRVRLFREAEFRELAVTGALPPDFFERIHLSCGRLIGLGRAAEYPDEHFHASLDSFPWGACGEVVNRPVLYPDGDLQACCCAGGKIAAFTVGNYRTASLAELITRMRERTHYRFINVFGPRQLFDVMQMATKRPPQQTYPSICDICVTATAGVAPEEVDRTLEHWIVRRLVSGDHRGDPATHVQADAAAEAAPTVEIRADAFAAPNRFQ